MSPASFAAEGLGINVEAAYVYDDNVTRAPHAEKLSDQLFSLNLNKNFQIPVTEHTRLSLLAFVGGEKFRTYTGLSRFFYGGQAQLQYRPSAEFDAPTFAVFARASTDYYDSTLRDGYRYSGGITVRKSLTDRIDFSAAVTRNVRDTKSTVFDTRDYSARVNVDYSLSSISTVYLGGEYRQGEVVSTARPALAFVDIAKAIVLDDAFPGMNRFAYRVDAATIITTLGYNRVLGQGHSLDFSWRWVQSTPTDRPPFPTERIRYRDNQLSVAYLFRF
jgi:hypothetical protein